MPGFFEFTTLPNFYGLPNHSHRAQFVRKVLIAPLNLTDKLPDINSANYDLDKKYVEEQRELAGETGVDRLSECLQRMPNIQFIEFKLDSRFIGPKELKEGLNVDLLTNYGYNCEKIFPLFLKALLKTTLRIKKFYVHFPNPCWDERGVMPHSATYKLILSPDTIKTVVPEIMIGSNSNFSTLEHLKIITTTNSTNHEYDVPTFNYIRDLLELAPRLEHLTLSNVGGQYGPDLSELLPRIHYAQLTRVSLEGFVDRKSSLTKFLGRHSGTIQVVDLDQVSIKDENGNSRGDEAAFRSLRNDYEFHTLREFEITTYYLTSFLEYYLKTVNIAPYLLRKVDDNPLHTRLWS